MPKFQPPTVLRTPDGSRGDRLFCRMKLPVGLTVLKSPAGGYTTVENPTGQEIDDAAVCYLGGHVYDITDEEAAALTAAGYEVTP